MPLDVMVVEKKTRKAIGRPWLAAAIHISTGYVLRTQLSFAPPSEKLCSETARLKREIKDKFGLIESLRPIMSPHFQGVVERFFMTLNKKLINRLCDNLEIGPTKCGEHTLEELGELIDRYVAEEYWPNNRK